MKEYKVFYIAEVGAQDAPDDGYRKLYPKADGWYMRGHGESEIRIGSLIIVDPDGVDMPARDRLKFGLGFAVATDSDENEVSLAWGDSDFIIPSHGNEAHDDTFATDADLTDHINHVTPHGIVLANIHAQNTDTHLGQGTADEVSAADLKTLINESTGVLSRVVTTYSGVSPYQILTTDGAVLVDATANNVDLVLPDAPSDGTPITCRIDEGANAMTVTRSGTDTINWNGNSWTGVTTDVAGTWFKLEYTNGIWYVTMDSGLTSGNEAI